MKDLFEETTLAIEVYEGKIIIDTPQGRYALDPHVAFQVANCIFEAVGHCGYELNVQVEKRQVTSMQRLALIARTAHILRTMDGKRRGEAPTHIVDSILADIL